MNEPTTILKRSLRILLMLAAAIALTACSTEPQASSNAVTRIEGQLPLTEGAQHLFIGSGQGSIAPDGSGTIYGFDVTDLASNGTFVYEFPSSAHLDDLFKAIELNPEDYFVCQQAFFLEATIVLLSFTATDTSPEQRSPRHSHDYQLRFDSKHDYTTYRLTAHPNQRIVAWIYNPLHSDFSCSTHVEATTIDVRLPARSWSTILLTPNTTDSNGHYSHISSSPIPEDATWQHTP